jgi:hypothetical protein
VQAGTTYTLTRVGGDDNALNGDLDITDSATILGAGPLSTIIDGNSGPTWTHALLAGSPGGCTDNLGTFLTTDQRGHPRPFVPGRPRDSGAFEFAY